MAAAGIPIRMMVAQGKVNGGLAPDCHQQQRENDEPDVLTHGKGMKVLRCGRHGTSYLNASAEYAPGQRMPAFEHDRRHDGVSFVISAAARWRPSTGIITPAGS